MSQGDTKLHKSSQAGFRVILSSKISENFRKQDKMFTSLRPPVHVNIFKFCSSFYFFC